MACPAVGVEAVFEIRPLPGGGRMTERAFPRKMGFRPFSAVTASTVPIFSVIEGDLVPV
jgi:hypothetical protein